MAQVDLARNCAADATGFVHNHKGLSMKLPFARRSPAPNVARPPQQPIEVGAVRWQRELTVALEQSAASNKPVFALFQEVPGCAGCRQFGAEVLSNPVIVEAIESAFVPLLIHNNSPGRDAEVLAAYGEPPWNYQVVRFLGPTGADVIERRDRVWETGPLAVRMVQALESYGNAVPPYLRLLEQESSDRLKSAFLVQGCFWVGESELGQIDGVVTTEAGFMDGHEVTHVRFDPAAVSLAEIVSDGIRRGVVSAVFATDDRGELAAAGVPCHPPTKYRVAKASDQKRQLRGRMSTRGLTPAQATKLNSFAGTDQVSRFLPTI